MSLVCSDRYKKWSIHCCALLVVAIGVVLALSPITSPLYGDNQMGVDGAVFYTIGRYWFEDGTLPYVDLWDLKGPIIYIVNGIGYLISQSIQGLLYVQVLFLFASLLFVYKLFSLRFSTYVTLVLTIGAALSLALNYEGGDCVEEFNMPFLVLSYYFIYRWSLDSNEGVVEHNHLHATVYGMTLGVALMTRLTNAVGVMGAVAFICVALLGQKKYKNLFANALWFVIGFIIVSLPIILYFWMNDALYEMWYGTILYNMEYAKNSVGGHSIVPMITIYLYGTALLFYGLYTILIRRKYVKGSLWVSSIVLMVYWLFGSNGYAHYGLLCFPALCVLVNEIGSTLCSNQKRTFIFTAIFLMFGVTVFGLRLHRTIGYSQVESNPAPQILIEQIPEAERNSVVMYNCEPELYYYNKIKPDNPYFSQQDFESCRGESLRKRIYEEFSMRNTKWLLYRSWVEESVIMPIIDQQYELYSQSGKYTLYKHK